MYCFKRLTYSSRTNNRNVPCIKNNVNFARRAQRTQVLETSLLGQWSIYLKIMLSQMSKWNRIVKHVPASVVERRMQHAAVLRTTVLAAVNS